MWSRLQLNNHMYMIVLLRAKSAIINSTFNIIISASDLNVDVFSFLVLSKLRGLPG